MQSFKELEVKLNEKSKFSHYLYVKAHNVREKVPQKPSNKTLFVVGIHPYCNEDSVKELFSVFGKVNSVYLHKNPSAQIPAIDEYKYFTKLDQIKGFKVGYVIFEKERFLQNALDNNDILILSSKHVLTGIQKWNQQYNDRFVSKKELEEEIKVFMDKFDEETNKKIQIEKDLSQPQEGGWVTVTRRGKKPGFARKESVVNQLKKRRERQSEKKELKDFYTFQIKESKMKNLIALRKKFEEDKKKIAALKEARRFKPF